MHFLTQIFLGFLSRVKILEILFGVNFFLLVNLVGETSYCIRKKYFS